MKSDSTDRTIKLSCGRLHSEAEIISAVNSIYAKRRKVLTKTGGRPLSDQPRCPCGANTLTRAMARKFDCCRKVGK